MFKELIEKKNEVIMAEAITYFCLKLGITQEERNILSVKIVERLSPGTHGVCIAKYKGSKLTEIEIKIQTYASIIGVIEVLAHEMVHAKQHLLGEFYFQTVPTKRFFGLFTVNINDKFHKGQSMTTTPYYDRQCEREAHSQSHLLITEFCKDIANAQSKTDSIKNEELWLI